jgi:hypothetical protein
MDKLCFSCADDSSSDIQEFDGVSSYEQQKELIRSCYASYALPGEFRDNSTDRKETLPIQNSTSPHSLLQFNSFLDDDDDDDDDDDGDDASREQAPSTPTRASILKAYSRANSCDPRSPVVHKPTLHPPISSSDTYTTVSMSTSQSSRDDDDDDCRSTTSTDACLQLFRPKRKHSSSPSSPSSPSSLKSGANEHESYRYLLRMKPQNYIRDGDDDTIGFQQLRPAYRNDCLPPSLPEL